MSIPLEQTDHRQEPGASWEPLDSTRESHLENGLSVDVEDYYQVEAFADRIRPEMWSQFPPRVVDNTQRVLKVLQESGAKATFFVLGCVAQEHPSLVREILADGHEVGCHSHMHRRVSTMTPDQFREDLRRARATIEDAGGVRVIGYRAPTFSIVGKSLWAIEILAEEGFSYDSSVFPVLHDSYGMPDAPRFPYRWVCRDGKSLYEIPPMTIRLLGRNLPVAGGGYLRILPMWYTRWALRRIRSQEGRPAVVYFHPWEIDSGQPRMAGRLTSRFRHYFNLSRMEGRIKELVAEARFVTLKTLLESQLAAGPLPTKLSTNAS